MFGPILDLFVVNYKSSEEQIVRRDICQRRKVQKQNKEQEPIL